MNFDQREFRIDTLTKIEPSFALLGFARALRVDTPDGSVNLGVPSGSWQKAQLMRLAWDAQHRKLYSLGVWAKRVHDGTTQEEFVAAARADLEASEGEGADAYLRAAPFSQSYLGLERYWRKKGELGAEAAAST